MQPGQLDKRSVPDSAGDIWSDVKAAMDEALKSSMLGEFDLHF